jgi:hypothetical protein
MTRRRGVGKAGIDRGSKTISGVPASVRCATLRRDILEMVNPARDRPMSRLDGGDCDPRADAIQRRRCPLCSARRAALPIKHSGTIFWPADTPKEVTLTKSGAEVVNLSVTGCRAGRRTRWSSLRRCWGCHFGVAACRASHRGVAPWRLPRGGSAGYRD